jgi:hypothetical protein
MSPLKEALRRSVLTLILTAGIGGWPSQAHATSFFERPFPESVKDAPVIVHGKVGPTYTDWGHEGDGSKKIFTYWELQVIEVLKGQAQGRSGAIRMREMGGEKDGLGMQVAGTAQFNPGEDVVVFLSDQNGEGSHDVWGMMMGKYNVQKDESGKEVISGPGINNLTRPRISDGDEGQHDTPGASKWTLDSLRSLIASQGDSPRKPKLTPQATSRPVGSESPLPAASLAAPQLQPSTSEETKLPTWPVVALGAGVLGFAWVLISRRKR